MKKKLPDKVKIRASGKKATPKKGVDTHSNIPRPEPMELAKLAALLREDRLPWVDEEGIFDGTGAITSIENEAVKAAMRWYVEAAIFVRSLPLGDEALIRLFGSEFIKAKVFKDAEPDPEPGIKLDMKADDDEARQFFRSKGINLKSARAVIETIKRCPPHPFDSGNIDEIIRNTPRDNEGRLNFTKDFLVRVAELAKQRRSEARRKSAITKAVKNNRLSKIGTNSAG